MLSSAHVNRSGRLKTEPPVGECLGDYAPIDDWREIVVPIPFPIILLSICARMGVGRQEALVH